MHALHDIDLNGDVLGNISSINHNTGTETVPAFASGAESPGAMYQGKTVQSTTVQTTGLAELLGLNSDLMISAGHCVTGNTSTLAFRERAGCVASSVSHQALTAEHLFAYIQSISGQQGQSATGEFMLKYLSDDSFTSPMTIVSGAVLSAAVLLDEYLLAKVVVDTVEVPELVGVTINPGFELIEQTDGAGPYPTDSYLKVVAPSIEVTTQDLATANALADAEEIATGVDVYFAKRKNGSVTETFASANHIKIASTDGIKHASVMQASRDDATATLKFDLALPPTPATQVCLAFTEGVAIP